MFESVPKKRLEKKSCFWYLRHFTIYSRNKKTETSKLTIVSEKVYFKNALKIWQGAQINPRVSFDCETL